MKLDRHNFERYWKITRLKEGNHFLVIQQCLLSENGGTLLRAERNTGLIVN